MKHLLHMMTFSLGLLAVIAAVTIWKPTQADALGLNFGSRTILSVIPCQNGVRLVSLISARTATLGAPELYIWTPATVTVGDGPPSHPGQQILGLFSGISSCQIGYLYIPAPAMTYEGTGI